MSGSRPHRRVQRPHRAPHEALRALIVERGWDAVSVQNRMTVRRRVSVQPCRVHELCTGERHADRGPSQLAIMELGIVTVGIIHDRTKVASRNAHAS